MAIKVKAIERKLKFEKGENAPYEYRYVLQADFYSKLSDQKVIQEADLRFGINKVANSLITSRRVIFTPNVEIKNELAKTSISITCYDRNGEIVKRVTSTDDEDIEDPENENPDNTGDNSGQQTPSGNRTQGSGDNTQGGNQSQTPPANNQGGGTQTGGDDEGGVGEY